MLRAPGTGAMRTARGLVCAAVCLLLGCMAHMRADGELPGPGAVLIAFGLLGVACVGLASRQRGFAFITGVLGVAQVGLHFGFGVLAAVEAAAQGPFAAAAASAHGADHYHGAGAAPGSVAGLVPALHDGLHAWTQEMAIGHGLATLVTAACMAYGERVVWWLAALVMPRLPLPHTFRVGVPARLGVRMNAYALLPARHGVVLASALGRRGPPAWAAAA